jgi:alpha-glucoside transport system substrate-binding protein
MRSRRKVVLAGAMGAALVLAACGSDDGDGDGGGEAASSSIDCAPYEEFGDIDGTEVTVYASIVGVEGEQQAASYEAFEECTGVTVEYEGSREFESQLPVRVQAGAPPDIAIFPQPGFLATVVNSTGGVVEPPEQVRQQVEDNYDEAWLEYGSVDDVFYAAPLGAQNKSQVWYSPSMFAEAGYEIPQSWEELLDLSETIATEQDSKPWCAGIGSGAATGWAATDWLEDLVLRTAGAEVYDQWWKHEIPFNDPQIVEALDAVGEILRNEDYVNAGLGDVQSIASTEWSDAGLPILSGDCWMMRMGANYASQWPEGTTVAEDGDVWGFYFPPVEGSEEQPIVVGAEFAGAFADRPEVQAFQTYLASADWANEKALVTPSGWASAHAGLDPNNLQNEFDKLTAEQMQAENAVTRFDAGDLMPGEVGSGTFWTGMVDWISQGTSSEQVTSQIENSWPS